MDLVEIIHLDGEVWYRRARSPLGRDADLWRRGLSSCESQYPTEIHDQIQSKNVDVKSLGILDTVRCNIGHDALYRPAGLPTLYPAKTHPITLLDGGPPGLMDSIRRCHTGG
jgi:hypothetical protein